jgi:hypothetical protein
MGLSADNGCRIAAAVKLCSHFDVLSLVEISAQRDAAWMEKYLIALIGPGINQGQLPGVQVEERNVSAEKKCGSRGGKDRDLAGNTSTLMLGLELD